MTKYFLTGVTIEGFRGINNEGEPLVLSFKPNAVNSVFGNNGLGKSSIYDALAYAFKNTIPKFADLPASDAPEEYYTNRFHSAKKATIDLEFRPDDGGSDTKIRIERSATGIRSVSSSTGQANPDQFLRQFGTGTALMDYRAFAQFVEDAPLKRGRTFSGLLGLGVLSEYRQALETLANTRSVKSDFELETLSSKLRSATNKEQDATTRVITTHKTLLGSDVASSIVHEDVAAKVQLTLRGIGVIGSLIADDVFTTDFSTLRKAIKTAEGSSDRDRLAEVMKRQGVLEGQAPSDDEHSNYTRIRELLTERDLALINTGGAILKRLYEAGKVVVDSADWTSKTSCPLCESDDLSEPIDAHIDRHLKAYETAIAAENQARELWKLAPWAKRFVALGRLLHTPGTDESEIDRTFRSGVVNISHLDDAIARLSALDVQRTSELEALGKERSALEKALPPSLVTVTEQVEAAEQLLKALTDLQDATAEVSKVDKVLQNRERWATFITKAAQDFADAEVALSTAKTISLEADYKKLYEAVTRNPDVVPLLKKSPGSEELHLRLARFYGLSDVSAATLLPESYRNALAICIFLAASETRDEPARFMVLDDITSSFDNGHQFGLMELLRTTVAIPGNPAGPQIILLSHDGSLEKYFDKTANESSDWSHQKLQGMPPHGSVLTQPQGALRLRTLAERFLNAGQVAEAAPFIRQYLEYSLLRIIQKLDIPVPIDFAIRDDHKMADNCLKTINVAITLHSKAGDLILTATQQTDIRNSLVPRLLSNWINHFTTGTIGGLSPHVLLGVLDDIDKLSDCFKYPCGCSISQPHRFYRSLAAKNCGC